MKHLLLTTIATVVLVGCGPSVDIWEAAYEGNIEVVKQHLDAGVDVNAKDDSGWTPLRTAVSSDHKEIADLLIAKGVHVGVDWAITNDETETADLLRKHGGKTSEELKAEGK